MRFTIKILVISLLSIFCVTLSIGQPIDEYTIKALWLTKFPSFIKWPEQITDTSGYFIIGLYKIDPFCGKLDTLYKNLIIDNKPVDIRIIENNDEISELNILFIPYKSCSHPKKIINQCIQKGILVIGETNGIADVGAHINFIVRQQKVRFEINETSIRDSGFFVSFRLLNIAKIVQPIDRE